MDEQSSERPVFRSRRLERRFKRDGYVIVPFADPEELLAARRVYEQLDSGVATGYYASMHSHDLDYKAAVDRELRARFWDRLARLLVDHEPVVGAFMVKHPGEDSAVPPHQDWLVTDERRFGAINCWFPLMPVDGTNGQMSVLRGSHRYIEGLRGSPAFPTQIGPISDVIADEFLEPVDVPLGSAIIYENRLLHGTPPNRSHEERVVAYLGAAPAGSGRVHYYLRPDGTVEGSRVHQDFFVEFNIGDRPDGDVFVEIPDYGIEPLTADELRARHLRANRLLPRLAGSGYRDVALLGHP